MENNNNDIMSELEFCSEEGCRKYSGNSQLCLDCRTYESDLNDAIDSYFIALNNLKKSKLEYQVAANHLIHIQQMKKKEKV